MKQSEKGARFAALHVKGEPLLLYNAWDAGSAKSISEAGAKAIATSSWAVAEAQGYRDGEAIPVGLVEQIVGRIVDTIDLPVTVDFEGGYADDSGGLAQNGRRLAETGAVGCNFEDQVVGGEGLHPIPVQAERITDHVMHRERMVAAAVPAPCAGCRPKRRGFISPSRSWPCERRRASRR